MIQESLDDFRKRYKGTYLFLTIRGEKHLVRYETDDESNFCFYSGTYGDIIVDEETARENISFYFPPTGLYNVGQQAHFFTRNPLRQWKRAPCHDNTQTIPILQKLSLNTPCPEFDYSTAESLFFPKYHRLEIASKQPSLSIAVTKDFALSASHTEDQKKKLLWFHTSPVGVVDPENKTINVKYHVFYQEVLDFIRKKEPEWTATRN